MTDIRKYMKEREVPQYTDDLEMAIKKHRKKIFFAVVGAVAVLAAGVIAFLLIQRYKKYDDYSVEKAVNISGAGDCTFYEYGDYLLKYNNDGISYINEEKTIWNQPFEMRTPLVDICEDCVAISEAGGNTIYIYDKTGKTGEVSTQYPIINLEVSRQGVVAVITENDGADYFELYDRNGNMKVSGRSVLTGEGKPVDISLSNDGTKLAVSYISIDNGAIKTKVAFYNYSEVGKNEVNRMVGVFSHYDDSIVPKVDFISNSVVAAFGEDIFTIYSMKQKPSKKYETDIKDKIYVIFYSDRYMGIVTRSAADGSGELTVYDTAGKVKLKKNIDSLYTNAKFDGNNVIMYNHNELEVISLAGVEKFKGSFKEEVFDVMTTDTRYIYLLVTGNGIQKIKLK